MEIKYPIVIIISIILFGLVFVLSNKKNLKEKNKNKIANSGFIKNTVAFKDMIKKYRLILYLLYVVIFIAVLSSSILSSRVVKEKTFSNDIYNRDIMLCMDISASGWEPDLELIEAYKDIVKSLNGERFGISIFNTTSVLLVPLTDDYDYVLDTLDKVYKGVDYYLYQCYIQGPSCTGVTNQTVKGNSYNNLTYDERNNLKKYVESGTIIGANSRGSSFSGDGLASCVFDFPSLEQEERSRIIVLSTDNDYYGPNNNPDRSTAKQYIDVSEAAKIAKKNKISVYTIAPTVMKKEDEEVLKSASTSTGGKYYVFKKGPTVKEIVSEIESREKSLLKGQERTTTTDYPIVPFIILLLSFVLLIIVDRMVLL